MKNKPAVAAALLNATEAARVVGVSERTFHALRSQGRMPLPVMLGPRALRWVRSELETAVAALPRQEEPRPLPSNLRNRVEALKGGVK